MSDRTPRLSRHHAARGENARVLLARYPDRDRLRHLLMAAFTEDRPTINPRSCYALVARILDTPAGQLLAREFADGALAARDRDAIR